MECELYSLNFDAYMKHRLFFAAALEVSSQNKDAIFTLELDLCQKSPDGD